MTGAAREKVSHVFVLDWSLVDSVYPVLDGEGNNALDARGRPRLDRVFHPRFNFLSPKLVPPPGPNRDTYIDSIAKIMIPDKGAAAGDTYFADQGRAALTGFIHLIVAKVNDRPAGDPKRYTGIPRQWHGFEASIPMLVDLLATSQFNLGKGAAGGDGANPMAAEEQAEAEAPQGQPGDPDAIGKWIEGLASEANPDDPQQRNAPGTSSRAFLELTPLIRMADKERSGVLGTMNQALLPFKNEAVKQRTSACDFTPDDLRGIWDEAERRWVPITLYVCANQAEAEAFATITALLYEVLSRYLLSYGPNEVNNKTGRKLGDKKVAFVLDEFAKMPRIPAVVEGPDLGRSKGVSYILCAQDYAQIKKKYTEDDVQILNSTTAVKYVLPQNNHNTIETVIKMVGKTTIRRGSHSYTEGAHREASPFKWNRSDQAEETDFLRPADIGGMRPGQHIVLVQNFLNRPMKLRTDFFFKNRALARQVRSRGKGPVATRLLPDHVRAGRLAESDRQIRLREIEHAGCFDAIQRMVADEEALADLP